MNAPQPIDLSDDDLLRLLHAGCNDAEIAHAAGVPLPGMHLRLDHLRGIVPPDVRSELVPIAQARDHQEPA